MIILALISLAAVALTVAAILSAPEGAEIPGVGFVYRRTHRRMAVRKLCAGGSGEGGAWPQSPSRIK
jgi:hypothetical protein